ncbi:Ig-like domain-containing protein [Roseomonas marmotae]|uniref:LysM peptidoglycan-binding domain-containing protein n=1 Tax=Roseomonas marmotae TaxID=2768161 RepID=A0ABS3K803_9PROT|nr:Ig-like domain-containing protein [Roseomonas marmotae]MBO1073601.1 LysM peptidoglycan-binding domain-containing protein [Roseomonas marmotae]QTI80218.1 LysM peptidoglycan-binding domain-containing protein [Roseomonas marmotae]
MTDRMRMGLALGGLASMAALAGGLWWQLRQDPGAAAHLQPVVAILPQRPAEMPAAPLATAPEEQAPRFDVARIGPKGGTVVAGRAAPGAEVTLEDQGRELGRARADSRGEFVILPAEPLSPGAHELSLRARDSQGQDRQGEDSVVVMVPEAGPAAEREAPVAVLLPPTGGQAAPRVLQGATPAGQGKLGVDILDYDDQGGMRFSGTAAAGGTVRVYIDQHHAGDTRADETGRWSLTPAPVPEPGRHTLRVDQMGAQGKVTARLELPFQRDAGASPALAAGRVVVQPGHNLWRIARATYGRGIRYTVIHRANAGQIRDPALIYPGQIFTLPNP